MALNEFCLTAGQNGSLCFYIAECNAHVYCDQLPAQLPSPDTLPWAPDTGYSYFPMETPAHTMGRLLEAFLERYGRSPVLFIVSDSTAQDIRRKDVVETGVIATWDDLKVKDFCDILMYRPLHTFSNPFTAVFIERPYKRRRQDEIEQTVNDTLKTLAYGEREVNAVVYDITVN